MFSGDCFYFQCCWHRTYRGSGHTLEHRKNDDLWSCCQKLTLSKQEVGGVAARKWQARWSATGFKLLITRPTIETPCHHPTFVWLFGRGWQLSDPGEGSSSKSCTYSCHSIRGGKYHIRQYFMPQYSRRNSQYSQNTIVYARRIRGFCKTLS
jgi:hypothetical protein